MSLMPPSPDERSFEEALERVGALGGYFVFDRFIQMASLARTDVTDDDLALFEHLPAVEMIDLSDTSVTDAGLARLAALDQLETLILVNTRVSEQAAEAFRRDHPTVQVMTVLPETLGPDPFTDEAIDADGPAEG